MHNSQSISSSYHSRTAGKIQSSRKRSWVRTGFCYYISVYECVSAVCERVARVCVLVETRGWHTASSISSLLTSLRQGLTGNPELDQRLKPQWSSCLSSPTVSRLQVQVSHLSFYVGPGDFSLDLSDWAISPGPHCVYFCEPGKYYIITFAQILLNFFLLKGPWHLTDTSLAL